jgi:hypothetical protein
MTMKRKYYTLKNMLIWLWIILLPGGVLFGQEEEIEKISPSLTFTTIKESSGDRLLSARFRYRKDKVWTNIDNLQVTFIELVNGEEKELATVTTNDKGIGELRIHKDYSAWKNEEGYMTFIARSVDNDQFESAEEELAVRDLTINIRLTEEDDLKTVEVSAYSENSAGEKEMLDGEDVSFLVPRMFSNLLIGQETLAEGNASLEFPNNLLGDSVGNLKVLVKLDEHADFGTVEAVQDARWGKPVLFHLQEHPTRGLWAPTAPLWMLITLVIMLLGVWGHYIYSFIQIYLIYKIGKKLESKTD